jgi:hypothetical protein
LEPYLFHIPPFLIPPSFSSLLFLHSRSHEDPSHNTTFHHTAKLLPLPLAYTAFFVKACLIATKLSRSSLPSLSNHPASNSQQCLQDHRTLASRPWKFTFQVRYIHIDPKLTSGILLTHPVRRSSRTREIRWRCYREIHHWPRPDKDVLLRRPGRYRLVQSKDGIKS